VIVEILFDRKNGGLGVERIEDGFDQEDISAARNEAVDGFGIRGNQFIEADIAVARVVHVRADRAGAVGRAEYAGAITRLGRILGGFCYAEVFDELGRSVVDFPHQCFHVVIGHGDAGGVETVGFDDVSASVEIGLMNAADHVRARQHQEIVIAFQVRRPIGKALAAIIGFRELVALDHRAHAAIQNQNALGKLLFQFGEAAHGLNLQIEKSQRF